MKTYAMHDIEDKCDALSYNLNDYEILSYVRALVKVPYQSADEPPIFEEVLIFSDGSIFSPSENLIARTLHDYKEQVITAYWNSNDNAADNIR